MSGDQKKPWEARTARLYRKAWEKWGAQSQITMLAEEASELSVASLHCLRALKDPQRSLRDLAEEIADCQIMIEQVAMMLTKTVSCSFTLEVFKARHEKLNRLAELLGEK